MKVHAAAHTLLLAANTRTRRASSIYLYWLNSALTQASKRMNVNCFRIQIVDLDCVEEEDTAREWGSLIIRFFLTHDAATAAAAAEGECFMCELTTHNFSKSLNE
jgi:hypothetical protein